MNNNQNWYEMAKGYPLKEYLETVYHMEFRANKTLCPFHADSKPTLSVKNNLFKCFSCDAGGDITRFVEMKENLSSLEAVKKVLLDNGVDVAGEVKALSPEQQAEHQKKLDADALALAKKRVESEAEQKKAREFAIKNMNLIAERYSGDLNTALQEGNQAVIDEVQKVFPRYFMIEGALSAIGWDWDNETVVTVTRHKNGNVLNIKRRTMQKNFIDWNVTKDFYTWKGEGKWIGWKDSVTYPFGIQFQRGADDRIILCEGEKDALNLISLGVNALTLGGVTSKWEPFLAELKNKKVYIWFDHDKAGYLNAIKRWNEINKVAKSCQIVLFSKLEQDFQDKGDISDYLELHKLESAEQVFTKIVYSSFVPHNELLVEIDELYNDWKNERPTDFLTEVKQVEFKEISSEIVKNAQSVRGEKDNELKAVQFLADELNNSSNRKNIELMLTTLFNSQPDYLSKEIETLKKFTNLKKTVLNNYRQVHIYDITQEAIRTIKASGYMFATYRGALYLWTGAYYYRFKVYDKIKSEIGDFVLQKLFPAIELDFKKQTLETSSKVIENIFGQSQSLEEWIDPKKRILTMQNGALLIRSSGKYIFKYETNKKDCAFNILDFHYNENSTAPKWQKFLNRVLPAKEDQEALMEFVGYCLMPSHRFEKFLLLYGETGANGKSVVLDVIKSFFGKENISGLQLQNFTGHEIDALNGKILNIGSELDSQTDLKDQISALKNLVSTKDTLTINPKFEKPYEIDVEQKPKMAFASNGIPKQGVDGGFFRRALVFNFDVEINDDEKIRDLVERFEDEKAGILNMALAGLDRLIKNGKFSMSEKREQFMEQYRDDADPTRAYAKESLRNKKGVMVAKNYVFEHYKAWCEERGHRVMAQRNFFKRMSSHLPHYEEKRTTLGKDELLPSNSWYILNTVFKKTALEEFKYKGGTRETKHCAVEMKTGCQITFE